MAAKDACLLNIVAVASPRFLNFGQLKIFIAFLDDASAFLSRFYWMMNALGELHNYLFEDWFANKIPDFLQLGIEKCGLVLGSFQLIFKALKA
jgi:hypothetical protein